MRLPAAVAALALAPPPGPPARHARAGAVLSAEADGADLYSLRFGGVGTLLGDEGLARLRASHVVVVGLGGVGSWTVEALARSGVGSISLVDADEAPHLSQHTSRPAHLGSDEHPAVRRCASRTPTGSYTRSRRRLVGRRRARSPTASPPSTPSAPSPRDLSGSRAPTPPISCALRWSARAVLLSWRASASWTRSTRRQRRRRSSTRARGSARTSSRPAPRAASSTPPPSPSVRPLGAKSRRISARSRHVNALSSRRRAAADLAGVSHDPLLAATRAKLRRKHGWPAGKRAHRRGAQPPRTKWRVRAVYSAEVGAGGLQGELDSCERFGTAGFVTGAFGLAAAGSIVTALAAPEPPRPPRCRPHAHRRPTAAPAAAETVQSR